MVAYVRRRNTAIAVKAETTSGSDAFSVTPPDPAADFVRGDLAIQFNQNQITVPEVTASLDGTPSIPGGTKVQIDITVLMRGSGTAGTAPRWGRMMQFCSWKQITVATAIGVPTALTAGSATTATLQSPFSGTAEAHRGAPIVLSGNPATPATDFISDYTASRVATLGAHSYSPVLDTSTLAQIPAHVRYEPTSDNTLFQTGTIAIFMDGLLWKFTGCAGTFTITLTTGGLGQIKFTLTGIYNQPTSTTQPTGVVFDTPTPPVFRDGICRIDRNIARASQVTYDAGVALGYPENPEAPEGYDASINTGRDIKGSIDPLMAVTDTIARAAAFKAGTVQPIVTEWGEVAGNKFGVVVPAAQYTGYTPQNRNDLMAEQIPFAATGQDSGLYLVAF